MIDFNSEREIFEKHNRQKPASLQPTEIDERFCCTNTDFGGDDPGKVDDTEPVATIDPTPDTI